jgi:hypothetical protein
MLKLLLMNESPGAVAGATFALQTGQIEAIIPAAAGGAAVGPVDLYAYVGGNLGPMPQSRRSPRSAQGRFRELTASGGRRPTPAGDRTEIATGKRAFAAWDTLEVRFRVRSSREI